MEFPTQCSDISAGFTRWALLMGSVGHSGSNKVDARATHTSSGKGMEEGAFANCFEMAERGRGPRPHFIWADVSIG